MDRLSQIIIKLTGVRLPVPQDPEFTMADALRIEALDQETKEVVYKLVHAVHYKP